MADSQTTNYNFTLPEVGASEDSWGAKLNQNWTDVDADLKAIDNKLDGTTAVTGIDINSGSIDGTPIGATTPSTGAFTALSATSLSTTGDITFGDNDKAIFGAGSDLQIYHDGLNSYISDTGTGRLNIQSGSSIVIEGANGDNFFSAVENAEAALYYDNAIKLATTSTGIDVTGTATMDAAGIGVAATGGYDLTVGDFVNFPTNAANYLDFTGAGAAMIVRTGAGPTNAMQITAGNDVSFYEDTGTTAKFFWDASAESLGIGTASPNTALHLNASDGLAYTYYTSNIATTGARTGFNGTDFRLQNYENGSMQFYTNNTERMRLDSSGNLLVGTTDGTPYASNVKGAAIYNSGAVSGSVDGLPAAYFNRKTSDGTIVDLRKDGTTVGSISVENGNINVGSNDTGIRFDSASNCLIPVNMLTNAVQTNTTDLGSTNYRWKDLYLSGGVYLGGTGAANHLDNYETGTFTPYYAKDGTGTDVGSSYNLQNGRYTKVGNIVYYSIDIQAGAINTTTASSFISIGGFPFASGGSKTVYPVPTARDCTAVICTANHVITPFFQFGASYLFIQETNITTNTASTKTVWNSSGRMTLHGFYYTA